MALASPGAFLRRAAIEQPEAITHRCGAFDVQLGDLFAQQPVDRAEVKLIRLAGDRPVSGEGTDEAARRSGAEPDPSPSSAP